MRMSRTTASGAGLEREPPERLVAVRGELHAVALELEGAPKGLANGALVVDDEDVHGCIVRTRRRRLRRVLATS